MKINKLTIDNFRSYQDLTAFVFAGEENLNIILGQNGSGKTSFLSAIKYAIFGPRMFGSDFYTKDYINWAQNEINFNTNKKEFTISLEFTHNEQLINVSRTSNLDVGYTEHLELSIDGIVTNDTSYLDKFDYNLFNNIFFNGENISNLTANSREMNMFIERMIDSYFELDVFKAIINDTNSSITKSLKKIATNEYTKLEKDLKLIAKKIKSYNNSLHNINTEIEQVSVKVVQLQAEMKRKHALSSSEEVKIKNTVDMAKRDLLEYETNLVEFLKVEANNILMKAALSNINKDLAKTRGERYKQLKTILAKLDRGEHIAETDGGLIPLDVEIAINNRSMWVVSKEVKDSLIKYNSSQRRLKMNQKKLADSDAGKKLLNFNLNLEFLTKQLTELEKNKQRINEKLEAKCEEQDKLMAEIGEEKKRMLGEELSNNAEREKKNLIDICDIYLDEQSNTIFNQVAGSMENILKTHLLRKSYLIDSISISDYKLLIITSGKVRDISSFSSGEQQLFLIAFIFAVLSQSKTDVPLILDTFFARIDDAQQTNLINYLNNELTNQILFIATDSELTSSKIDKFKTINKIYKLENDGYETKVEEPYAN